MKQWITFIIGFLSFLAVTLMIVVIVAGNKPFSEAEQGAIERVKSENLLAEVMQAYLYTNEQAAVTVIGEDADGKLKAVFVPTGKGEMQNVSLEGTVTAEQARKAALAETDVKEILHTKLGLEKDGAVWEVAFVDQDENLNYVYISASDGTKWKQILNM